MIFKKLAQKFNKSQQQYISGMTDNYAIEKFEELFVPIGWHVR